MTIADVSVPEVTGVVMASVALVGMGAQFVTARRHGLRRRESDAARAREAGSAAGLASWSGLNDRLMRQIDRLQAQVDRCGTELTATQVELTAARRELATAERRITTLEVELSALRGSTRA